MEDNILDRDFFASANDPESKERLAQAIVDSNEALKAVRSGRVTLIVIIVFTVISTFIEAGQFQGTDEFALVMAIDVGLILLYIAGAVLLPRFPYPILLVALIVYVLIALLSMIGDPAQILRGLIVKGLIVYYLIKALSAAKKLPELRNRLEFNGATQNVLHSFDDLQEIEAGWRNA